MKTIMKRIYSFLVIIFLKIKYRKKNVRIKSFNISRDIILERNVSIGKKVYISNNVKIGKYSYCNSNFNWSVIESNVSIGSFCSIGPGVSIALGNHNYNYVSTHPFLYDKEYGFVVDNGDFPNIIDDDYKETIIGNDVWIGANSNIKRGVRIGNGVVIAMNSVVTHDIPDYAVVAGVPARIIKYRFTKDEINFLLENPWWNMTDEKIDSNLELFYDINNFKKGH